MLMLFVVVSPRVLFRDTTFLIFINDLHFAMKYCKVHHFADDTNLLNFNNSIKKIKKNRLATTYNISHIGSMLTKFALMSIKLVSSPIQINMKADRNYFEAKIKQ